MNRKHWIYSATKAPEKGMTQTYYLQEEVEQDAKGNSHIPRKYLCARTDNPPGATRRENRTGMTRVYLD